MNYNISIVRIRLSQLQAPHLSRPSHRSYRRKALRTAACSVSPSTPTEMSDRSSRKAAPSSAASRNALSMAWSMPPLCRGTQALRQMRRSAQGSTSKRFERSHETRREDMKKGEKAMRNGGISMKRSSVKANKHIDPGPTGDRWALHVGGVIVDQ